MGSSKSATIQDKLTAVMLVTAGVALLATAMAFAVVERRATRESAAAEIDLLARTLGAACAPALQARHVGEAERLLGTLASRPGIPLAGLYDADGRRFASYVAAEVTGPLEPPPVGVAGYRFTENAISVYRPVIVDGEQVGTVWLTLSLESLTEQMLVTMSSMSAVALMSLILAGLLATRLQRVISGPLEALTVLAERVTSKRDYSLRAEQHSEDEVGRLAGAFNEMLGQIEARDRALESHRERLEEKVAERTHELVEVNERLARTTQEAEAASEAKTRFLANMSHEIRTPMNGVLGMARLLQETALDAEQQELASTIADCGGDLMRLIDDVLDVSKIEAGRLELEHAEFDVRAVVAGAAQVFRPAASDKGLSIDVRVDAAVPACLVGDSGRLRQIVLNFLSNAVKFTSEGSIVVSLEGGPATDGGFRLGIAVADTGIGIAPDRRDRLFKLFSQVDASDTRRFGGSGLGLLICKELAEAMGGEVGVQSEVGIGSTFWCAVHLARPDTGPEHGDPSSVATGTDSETASEIATDAGAGAADEGASEGGPLHVLVAEDNPVNQRVVVGMLNRLGHTCDVAADGHVALEMLAQRDYALVLMDCQMPNLDGWEATRRIRRLEQQRGTAERLPVVALTASALAGDAERCREAGMDDHAVKPIDASKLAAVLRRWSSSRVG